MGTGGLSLCSRSFCLAVAKIRHWNKSLIEGAAANRFGSRSRRERRESVGLSTLREDEWELPVPVARVRCGRS